MLHPASGTGQFAGNSRKIIRFVRKGCTNRPFFHIVVAERDKEQYDAVIEQLGTYDPLVNQRNEKLISLNFERIQYWIGNGADTTKRVKMLLGLVGFFPIYPVAYMHAWRNRKRLEEEALKELAEKDKIANESSSSST